MRLHITVGYDGTGSDATPTCLYCGPNGDAARAAMKTTDYVRFLVIQNPVGIRKSNDAYVAPPVSAPALPPLEVQPDPDNSRKRR